MPNRKLLENLAINLNGIQNSGKVLCPKCSHDRKKKADKCLSVNVVEGTYKCHNCDWKGGVLNKVDFMKKDYFRPVYNKRTTLEKKVMDWFFTRSITPQTILDMRVSDGQEWMPQTQKVENVIHFNYFRNNELVNVKYRDGAKNFKMVKNAELIFFNLDSIIDGDECIITEGEIDAMSWHQCGYKSVVSVPNGASKNQRLEYLDNCYQYFENKTKIYLSTDDDAPGRELRDELARRLGFERCFKLDFKGCKDANEFMTTNGPQALYDCLVEAQAYPIVGVFSIDDVWNELTDFYHNGLPEGDRTGDHEFDEHLRFMPGELTIITGIPGHGKSIFLDQISLRLCLTADWQFAVFSPESYPLSMYYSRLIKRLTGEKLGKFNLVEADLIAAKDWLKAKYHLIFPEDEGFTLDIILNKTRQLVLRKGVNALIIDPWSYIESEMPNGFNDVKFIQESLRKIVAFARKMGIHVFLVAHPTKMLKDKDTGIYIIPNLYNISGSAHFFNMPQNGFTVYRNHSTEKTEVHIQKVKWEHLGKLGMIEYQYNPYNSRFTKVGDASSGNWLSIRSIDKVETPFNIRPTNIF